ncbi:MAG: flagellar protein FliT [Gammaproteobacteria bacterium]|nr:flagellar protein FliT [Gammaproteobacteria bacterium]
MQMQKKANQSLWDDIIELEQQRAPLLNSAFPIATANNEIRTVLQKLIKINQVVGQQCMQEKEKVRQQLQDMNSNKKAVSAYSNLD